MKRTTEPRPTRAAKEAPIRHEEPGASFWADLRATLIPAHKWHYVFHGAVIAVALSYWVGSLVLLKEASWAEIVMYRPAGDNQLWPVVTALSHFNFGDPTDALKYGQGIGGFHAVILLPHALAYAVFGAPGYMIADVVFFWCYFVAVTMLLRRWGLGALASAALGAALATVSLQSLLQKIAQVVGKLLSLFKLEMAEWGFPDLVSLSIFGERFPRPLPTEIFVVLILYFLARQWQARSSPTLKRGLAVGMLMGLLMQGDPYSFSALGLLCVVTLVRTVWLQKWKMPWLFCAGAIGGAALSGWYFVVQMLGQHPDSAARIGLAPYTRSEFHVLPGYAPWLRILLIFFLVMLVRFVAHRRGKSATGAKVHGEGAHPAAGRAESADAGPEPGATLAFFAFAMVLCAWLAQPLQLFILGKGAQIYHYFLFTLPSFYAYAFLLLLIRLFKVLNHSPGLPSPEAPWFGSKGCTAVVCGGAVLFMVLLGAEDAMDVIKHSGPSRRDASPWVAVGDAFRPNLRALDKEFRENPVLRNTRSFATFCQEANFLLTAFHGKRAYLPDNAFTTLSDEELEERLFRVCRFCQFTPESFGNIIQDWYTMNYWLGCAKYWCSSDYKFAPDAEYPPDYLEAVARLPKQTAFNLAMPRSEFIRLTGKYDAIARRPNDPAGYYPDILIMTSILKERGIRADPGLYREVYTNQVFSVYTHVAGR